VTVRVVEVTLAQKEAAQLLIELQERDGDQVRDWTRKIAAAKRRPNAVDPELVESDEVVLYLV
jgi:hypothetical protein